MGRVGRVKIIKEILFGEICFERNRNGKLISYCSPSKFR